MTKLWEQHKTIAHYSNLNSILSILKSRELHASRFDYLEDQAEIVYAKNILKNVIYDEYKKIDNHVTYKAVCHELDEIAYPAMGSDIFIISFSQIENNLQASEFENDGFLSMWRYYAKDDGCYIEFDTETLSTSWKPWSDKVFMVFDHVIYDTKANNDSQELARQCAKEIKKHYNKEQSDILSPFFELAARCKHPAFIDEREIRLAILNSVPTINGTFPIHVQPCNKIYIKFPFEPKAVKKIVIGPSKDQCMIYQQIKHCLDSIAAYSHVEIAESKIPIVMHQSEPN